MTDTVTKQELAEALEKQGLGFLKMLGIELTAEMGQTPWLRGSENGSQQEPLVDLDLLGELVHDMTHNQKVLLEQGTHPYGLCDTQTCPTCRDQRRVFAQGIAKQVESAALAQAGSEIDKACEYAGTPELRDALMQVLDSFRKAGSPGLDEPELEFVIEPD